MLSKAHPNQHDHHTLQRQHQPSSTQKIAAINGHLSSYNNQQIPSTQARHNSTPNQGRTMAPVRNFEGVQNGSPYSPTSSSSSYAKPAEQWMARRTPSNATNSTHRSGNGEDSVPNRTKSDRSVHRSSSDRSQNQPDSYVLAMRRQRATVFCERSQPEDAVLLAKQKAAKARAAKAIGRQSLTGTHGLSASSKSKARYGKDQQYGYSESMHGAPVRLSATEVGDDAGEDADDSYAQFHQRSHSGRSSTSNLRQGQTMNRRNSPSSEGSSIKEDPQAEQEGNRQRPPLLSTNSSGGSTKTSGTGSGNQSRENSFGNIGALTEIVPRENHALYREKSVRNPEELRRRGSVDERTVTMTGAARLFVTNPDDS